MTTVVWDGKILAADGRITGGSTIVEDDSQKIHKIKGMFRGEHMLAYGYAGCASDGVLIREWLEDGAIEDDYPEDLETHLIMITNKNAYETFDGALGKLMCMNIKKSAMGSGGDFALSAMLLGMNAVDAVKHACKLDIYSGGKIRKLVLR
jgi:ATP-dependent protease HslVU (ClpYQ) peptidase subunit